MNMSLEEFHEKLKKLSHLCGFVLRESSSESFYEQLKYIERDLLLKAMKKMSEDPPSKLTLKAFRYFIRECSEKSGTLPQWTGVECKDENCNQGLIDVRISGNSYVFRCMKCKGSTLYFIAPYTPEEVDRVYFKHKQEEMKLESPKEVDGFNMLENLTNSIGG